MSHPNLSGADFKAGRKASRVTQEELATWAGVKRGSVSHLEQGIAVSADVRNKLQHALLLAVLARLKVIATEQQATARG